MKILWIARTCPYPPTDGEKLRVHNLLKHLARKHELTLVCRVMNDEDKAGLETLKTFCAAVYGVSVPRPAGFFEKIRWVLPFVFSKYPISMSTVFFRDIAWVLRELGNKEKFDIIQVEHSSLAIYLDHTNFSGNPLKVVTMHNIDYIRNERVIANLPLRVRKLYHLFNQSKFKNWEIESLRQFDAVITMSDLDRDILTKNVPRDTVHIVENGVDTGDIEYNPACNEGRTIIFVASMDSEANHDAALYFLNDIFPLLKKKHPAAGISFVGRNPRPELLERSNGADIIVTGKVDNVFDYYREAAIAVVPLRSGGGTRLKILEAMAAGVPVVTTSIGCEGLNVRSGENLMVADAPEPFADAIGRLFNDGSFQQTLVQKARRLVEAEYDWRLIAKSHDEVYRSVARETHA